MEETGKHLNWKIDYIESEHYVRVTFEGIFMISQQSEMFRDLVSRAFWKPDTALLIDNRNLDFAEIDFPTIQQASNNFQSFNKQLGKGKFVMLMKSTLDFAHGRQFEMISENNVEIKMRVFTDEEEAIKWLLNKR